MAEKPRVLRNEPLSRYTSWRVGGPADLLCRPASLEELQMFLAEVPRDQPDDQHQRGEGDERRHRREVGQPELRQADLHGAGLRLDH